MKDDNDDMVTSSEGEDLTLPQATVNRRKRSLDTKEYDLKIQTTGGMLKPTKRYCQIKSVVAHLMVMIISIKMGAPELTGVIHVYFCFHFDYAHLLLC